MAVTKHSLKLSTPCQLMRAASTMPKRARRRHQQTSGAHKHHTRTELLQCSSDSTRRPTGNSVGVAAASTGRALATWPGGGGAVAVTEDRKKKKQRPPAGTGCGCVGGGCPLHFPLRNKTEKRLAKKRRKRAAEKNNRVQSSY
jgi:hypothetical protein